MRLLAALFSASALLMAPSDALAGGVGLLGSYGVHQDAAYYYRDDGEQGVDRQLRPTSGVGIELLLGDRDDRLQGIIRFHGVFDSPPENPDLSGESGDYEYLHPDYDALETRRAGAMGAGLQWGLYGDPNKFQLIATTVIGSAFMTPDNLEFAYFQPGVGVTYTLAKRYQFVATLDYTARFRKSFNNGGGALIGFRYMID